MVETENHAAKNARGWTETLTEVMSKISASEKSGLDAEFEGDVYTAEKLREHAENLPLSVEVRGGWHTLGADDGKPAEYCILLTTGGPALRIIGDLDENGDVENAILEYQDWGTPWMEYVPAREDESVLAFARLFYFGD